MVRPKKHLGQHFLTDLSIAGRIVDALEPARGDTVIEIGPGTGVLTGLLLDREIRLLPVEIDPESAEHLKNKWPVLNELLIEKDFLKLEIDEYTTDPFHVIGNFPYNISSQIFFRILNYRHRIPSVVCMIQKEVAERIASPPGSRAYGILSVLLQAYFDIQYLFSVKPGSFFPPPKVTSGVIRLNRNNTKNLPCDEKLFVRIVKTTFNQRRKMIRNSLKSILLNLDSNFELLTKRPEQLGIPEFIELTRWVESQQTVNSHEN
ncbi:MAG: 16S rRNA (adenine(1518)-N(6)/adenine(1519)-N(6))-dimethyltransferase RsmA [Bacteroidales bacterium]|nr:16S rRNA (adenine(1518)-N(6)/adenine(1519)-N(6))-dimethyltransferase RsmA [Bacteroidales bacterium]